MCYYLKSTFDTSHHSFFDIYFLWRTLHSFVLSKNSDHMFFFPSNRTRSRNWIRIKNIDPKRRRYVRYKHISICKILRKDRQCAKIFSTMLIVRVALIRYIEKSLLSRLWKIFVRTIYRNYDLYRIVNSLMPSMLQQIEYCHHFLHFSCAEYMKVESPPYPSWLFDFLWYFQLFIPRMRMIRNDDRFVNTIPFSFLRMPLDMSIDDMKR